MIDVDFCDVSSYPVRRSSQIYFPWLRVDVEGGKEKFASIDAGVLERLLVEERETVKEVAFR